METETTITPLAKAENEIKTVERAVVKAFRAYVATPSQANRKALTDTLDAAKVAPALDSYRAEFVKANFS